MEKLAKIIGCILAGITLIGVGYKAGLRGEWITDGVMVRAIAQQAVEPAMTKQLEFELQYKRSLLRPLQRIEKEDRTEEEQDEINDLKEQIALLKCQLGKSKDCAPPDDDEE
jgi:hypothetical protein